MAKKKHYADTESRRASCGRRLSATSLRVSNEKEFWEAYADGSLCQSCCRAATNEKSPL